MTRTTVAGPVAVIDSRTSTRTDASTFPCQQATAALAGRPGTKPCILITDGVRCRHRTTSVGSRLRASRLNVKRILGGEESLRKARSASFRLFTTATPLPDQLPSDFSTAGKPMVARDVANVSTVTAAVGGAGMLSSRVREPIP